MQVLFNKKYKRSGDCGDFVREVVAISFGRLWQIRSGSCGVQFSKNNGTNEAGENTMLLDCF